MAQRRTSISRLFHELRRRKTFQAAATYIVFAWVLIEGASVVLPAFAAPEWMLPAMIVALTLGLPVAVVISWIFDLTLSGFERTGPEVESAESGDAQSARSGPVVVKPSVALPLGTARHRQVSLLRCSFELRSAGKTVSDPEAMLSLREPLDELIDNTAEHFSALCVERSGLSFELLFGYPVAFENDVLRACAAAFSIQHGVENLSVSASQYAGAALVASIGIHSDAIIVEATGEDDQVRVIGDISQVTGWLQSAATAGSIVLSEASRSLLRDKVRVESLGIRHNHHTGQEMQVFAAQELRPHDPIEGATPDSHHEMIGREAELALLLDRWSIVKEGELQVVVLRGEPGIGKSTLVREMMTRTRQNDDAQIIPLFCSPIESDNTFYPLIDYFLGPTFGSIDDGAHEAQHEHLARLLDLPGYSKADAAILQSALLSYVSVEGAGVIKGKSAVQSRRDLQHSLLQYFAVASRHGPLVFVIEDIQWADPSTLKFAEMLVQGSTGISIELLCLFSCRPEIKFDWMSRSDVFVLDLQRLPRRATERLIRSTTTDVELADDILNKIVAESDGNPFYAQELARAAAEGQTEGSNGLLLPGSIQQSLVSRMDKLGSAQPLLQLCSLLGKRFDYKLLLAVSETENEEALQADLRTLVNAGLLFQIGAVPESAYRFRHILMQEAAHASLLRATRTEQHVRIASIIEAEFPEKVQKRPQLLAYHYSNGALPQEAVFYRIKACRKALTAYAIVEAIEQAESGLRELDAMPASDERDSLEVTLLGLRAKGLLAIRGYGDPSVERAYARALSLTEQLQDTPQIFQLVVGLWMYFFIAGEAEHATQLARRLVRIAARTKSSAKTMQAQYCLGHSLFRLGRLKESLEQLELALETEKIDDDFSSESASGDDTRIHVRAVMGHVLWYLGDDARSVELSRQSVELAEELGNPFGIVFAAFMRSWLCMVRGDLKTCAELAARTQHVAEERGFAFWTPLAGYMQAWATCDGGTSGNAEERKSRIESMERSMLAFERGGGSNGETTLSLQIAEDCLVAGEPIKAKQWLERAEESIAETGEMFMVPDVTRISGLLSATCGDYQGAEKKLAAAQQQAHQMSSVSLAQRAADSIDQLHAGTYGRQSSSDDVPLPSGKIRSGNENDSSAAVSRPAAE